MATQGQRQNFQWRPNTYDSTTLTRYDQEAQHWVKAFKNASRPQSTFAGTMGTVGLIFQLIIHLIWLVVLLCSKVLKWIRT